MAFGDTTTLLVTDSVAPHVAPVATDGSWVEVIEAGKISTADAANVVVVGDVVDTRTVLRKADVGGLGTTLVFCVKYDDGVASPSASPRIVCIGRYKSKDGNTVNPWVKLRSKAGTQYADITLNPTKDMGDGTYKYTTPDLANGAWDTCGCNEFFFACETAAAATGDLTTASGLAKIL